MSGTKKPAAAPIRPPREADQAAASRPEQRPDRPADDEAEPLDLEQPLDCPIGRVAGVVEPAADRASAARGVAARPSRAVRLPMRWPPRSAVVGRWPRRRPRSMEFRPRLTPARLNMAAGHVGDHDG